MLVPWLTALATHNVPECNNRRLSMRSNEQFALYGRLGLIMAAFAVIGGIIAAPLLHRIWAPASIVAQR